jgi:hypothetical protein
MYYQASFTPVAATQSISFLTALAGAWVIINKYAPMLETHAKDIVYAESQEKTELPVSIPVETNELWYKRVQITPLIMGKLSLIGLASFATIYQITEFVLTIAYHK